MHKRSNLIPMASYYSLIFMGGAGFFSYIGLYYAQIKMNNAQIGLISAAGALISILAQPLWGTMADHAANKNVILRNVLFISALATWLIPLAGDSFWFLIGASVMLSFVSSAISPLGDSIALELARQENFQFSIVRMAGSVGFAIMSVIAGQLVALNIFYIFLLFFIFRFAAAINVFFIPSVAGHPNEARQSNYFAIFQDRKLVWIYLYLFVLCCTYGFFSSFHAIYSKQMGIGAQLIGLGVAAGSVSQFPFMTFFDKIYRRFGIVNILLVAGLVYILRWVLYVTVLNSWTIVPIWMLHGFNFILLYLCLAEYVSTNVPSELRTRGQVINSLVLFGVSSVTGSSLGGFAAQSFGIQTTFGIAAGIVTCAVIGFFVVTRFGKTFKE